MKRSITFFCLLFAFCCGFAQINKTILGCTIGQSSLSEVKSTMKSQGIKLKYERNEDAYVYVSEDKFVNFGGVKWNGVGFFFKDDKLYQVQFQYFSGGINTLHERDFTRALERKYSAYKQEIDKPVGSHYTKFFRSPDKMVCAFTCYPGLCILQYYDDKVFDRIADDNYNDL